ncbi:MAG: hypothetical protein Q8Q22_01475 [bacterium]|nr:hypothetical protein [bacterium]MDZ4205857.1 hypothetical protein [Patescibacteria group bacterium]
MEQSFADYNIASFTGVSGGALFFYLVAALFLGGTPALFLALYLAVSNALDFKMVISASVVTTIVWDTIWYSMGRFFSASKVVKLKIMHRNQKLFDKMNKIFVHWQYLALFLSRFVYGTSSIFLVVCGVRRMQYHKFLIINMLSILATIAVFTALSLPLHNISLFFSPYVAFVAILGLISILFIIRFLIRVLFNRYFTKEDEKLS